MKKQLPKMVLGKRFKIYYSLQVDNHPFRIRVFCNQEMRLEEPYVRYLQSGFTEAFMLKGCPVKFEFIGKPTRQELQTGKAKRR